MQWSKIRSLVASGTSRTDVIAYLKEQGYDAKLGGQVDAWPSYIQATSAQGNHLHVEFEQNAAIKAVLTLLLLDGEDVQRVLAQLERSQARASPFAGGAAHPCNVVASMMVAGDEGGCDVKVVFERVSGAVAAGVQEAAV
jgi:hypothetical protein